MAVLLALACSCQDDSSAAADGPGDGIPLDTGQGDTPANPDLAHPDGVDTDAAVGDTDEADAGESDGDAGVEDDSGAPDVDAHDEPANDADDDPGTDAVEDPPPADVTPDLIFGDVIGAECHSDADCFGIFFCLPPGEFIGCGICILPEITCETDEECVAMGANTICDVPPPELCVCAINVKVCQPPCESNDDCEPGHLCQDDGHCRRQGCENDVQCEPHFECRAADGGNSDKACFRAQCDGNDDCPGGDCVNGLCYPEPGTCTPFVF